VGTCILTALKLFKLLEAADACYCQLPIRSLILYFRLLAANTVSPVPLLANDDGIFLAEFDARVFPSLTALVQVRLQTMWETAKGQAHVGKPPR
jgi:hypothetical protein